MSRFLLLTARPEEGARAGELEAMRRASGLGDRLDTWPVDEAELPGNVFETWAGVITGGSPYSVTDPDSAKPAGQRLAESQLAAVAKRALDTGRPALFTCYGIGVVTRVLGGQVDRAHPEPVSAAESHLTDAGAVDDLAGVLPAVFTALTGHKESAPTPPPGATLLATNDVSPVQLYRAGSVWASQFHPEPTTEEFVARATAYAQYGYFDVDELAGVTARLRSAEVTAPRRLLQRFVELFG